MLNMHSLTNALDDLERQRTKIDAAITGLRMVLDHERESMPAAAPSPAVVGAVSARRQAIIKRAQKTATRLTQTPPTRTPPPVEKAARAGSVAATKPTPRATSSASGAAPLDTRLLAALATTSLKSGLRARDLASQLGVTQQQIRTVLYRLKARGAVVLTGVKAASRWSLATPPTATPKPASNPEFMTVFDGRRGQSLTGDYARKGTSLAT